MNDDALRLISRLQAERDALAGFLLEVAERLAPSTETDRILDYMEKLLPELKATTIMADELRKGD